MTVLESYALGVPVVATRMGGLPELVDDGVDGLLVAPDDPPALAAALERLIADHARAQDMGRTGCARVREGFSARRHLDTLSDLYQGVGRG
jgi:glycosyltransferase involved in cell wall biosynthesis